MHCIILLTLCPTLAAFAEGESFRVEQVTPKDGATSVELEPLIQIHTSEKFDPETVSEKSVRLLDEKGIPDRSYQVRVHDRLKSRGGDSGKDGGVWVARPGK